MKFFLRLMAVAAASCGVILLLALTTAVARSTWFGKSSPSRKGHVAVIDVTGMILSSSSTLKEIKDIQEDSGAKAVVVRINSPGGLVAPSQEMYEALKKLDKKIPVVITMSSLAASGGYYTALAGRKIWADPGTMTASIGVIMEFMNTEGLYSWAKVKRFTLKAGKFKDIGSPFRDMTADEKELMGKMLTDIHTQFKAAVKERRKLSDAEIEQWCDGRVMTGNQAFQAKLVDALGGEEDAIKDARKLGGLPEDAAVVYPENKGGVLKRLLMGDGDESSQTDLTGIVSQFFPMASNQRPGWRVMLLAPIR